MTINAQDTNITPEQVQQVIDAVMGGGGTDPVVADGNTIMGHGTQVSPLGVSQDVLDKLSNADFAAQEAQAAVGELEIVAGIVRVPITIKGQTQKGNPLPNQRLTIRTESGATQVANLDDDSEFFSNYKTATSYVAKLVNNIGERTIYPAVHAFETGTLDIPKEIVLEPYEWVDNLAASSLFDDIVDTVEANRAIVGDTSTRLFGNMVGVDKFTSAVYASNGRFYCVPRNSNAVAEVDPITSSITTFGSLDGFANASWVAGVLANNGLIYCAPGVPDTPILVIDPDRRILRTIPSPSGSWEAGVLGLDGRIYWPPHSATTSVLVIDPNTETAEIFGNVGGVRHWQSCVAAPNGKIFGVPSEASQVIEIDPATREITLFGSLGTGASKWEGGIVSAFDGLIYCTPRNSANVLVIDPVNRTTSTFGSLTTTASKWFGITQSPNGMLYCAPRNHASILAINPVTRTTSTFGSFGTGSNKWCNIFMAQNGRAYALPRSHASVLEIDFGKMDVNFPFPSLLSSFVNGR